MSDDTETINGHEIGGDTYYKVLVDGKSCNGGDFEYDLPEDSEPGDWTPEIDELEPCVSGYHLTNDPRGWLKKGCDIYIAEGKGNGVDCSDDKKVFHSVRLIEKVSFNTGSNNTGEFNSGDRNSGYRNSGNFNSGERNSGERNSGNWNSGYRNSGNFNSGDRNSGDRNSGNFNSGYRNSGYRNSGDWNSGKRHTGAFNTGEPEYYDLFNEPIKAEKFHEIDWPDWFYISPVEADDECDAGSYKENGYKKAWKESFEETEPEKVRKATELPNFDYEVFEEITGITKAMIETKLEGEV